MWTEASHPRNRGAALLAVLWLTAALSAIAFSVATTVRGEIERTATDVEGLQSDYLAAGGVERTICYMLWGAQARNPDGSSRYWSQGVPRLYHQFPEGDVIAEVIPAAARLNVNLASEEELVRLLLAIGAEPARAQIIAAAVIDWRRPLPRSALSPFDQRYLAGFPSFRARHASFQQVEELLLVEGMTPDLFYGTYVRDAQGRLVRRSGLRDCVSVYGNNAAFDINTADPALLRALGLPPPAVEEIVATRRLRPLTVDDVNRFRRYAGPAGARLAVGGGSIYTIRATARLRRQDGTLSDLRRSVAALVKFFGPGLQPPYQVLRWYDRAAAPELNWP